MTELSSAEVIRVGESVTLTWTTSGTVGACTVTRTSDDHDIEDEDGDHSVVDAPIFDTDYRLVCLGTSSGALTVAVGVASVTLSQDEPDRTVAVGEQVVARVLRGPHTAAPCDVISVTSTTTARSRWLAPARPRAAAPPLRRASSWWCCSTSP